MPKTLRKFRRTVVRTPSFYRTLREVYNPGFNDPTWIIEEFQNGRCRFGWSPPGTDLHELKRKDRNTWSDQEKLSWEKGRFLIERISAGHRIVVQPDQPIERFLIGEVVERRYEFDPLSRDDFNHILHVRPLTPGPISINAKVVSIPLKYDLSKRGRFYEIYPERSLEELDDLVLRAEGEPLVLEEIRSDKDTHDRTLRKTKDAIIREISHFWPGKEFEKLCEDLCNNLDGIEVKENKDRGKGWDLLVRVINPITRSILADEVPVQCKNYRGQVTEHRPIEDLERSIKNSETESSLALLFILGNLTDAFRHEVELRQERLSKELGRNIAFEIVDQDRIAELYAQYMSQTPQEPSSAE